MWHRHGEHRQLQSRVRAAWHKPRHRPNLTLHAHPMTRTPARVTLRVSMGTCMCFLCLSSGERLGGVHFSTGAFASLHTCVVQKYEIVACICSACVRAPA